jgi:hypothetical protein
MTLSRAPGYSAFLSVTHRLGMNPNVGDQLTLIG